MIPTRASGIPIALASAISEPTQSPAELATEIVFEQLLSNAEQSAPQTAAEPPSPVAGQVPLPTEPANHENSSILVQPQDLKSQAARDIQATQPSITKADKIPNPVNDGEQLGEPAAATIEILDTLSPIAIAVDAGTSPAVTKETFKDALPVGEAYPELTVRMPNGKPPISAEKSASASSGDRNGLVDFQANSGVTPDLLTHIDNGVLAESMSVSAGKILSITPSRELNLYDSGWLDQVARDIVDAQSDEGALTFRLMPRHLGALEIHLAQRDSGLAIEMQASNENAVQIIASAEPRLTDELRQRGVTIAESSVQSGPSGDGRQARSAPNPEPLQLPFREIEQISHPDDDHHERRPAGRFA